MPINPPRPLPTFPAVAALLAAGLITLTAFAPAHAQRGGDGRAPTTATRPASALALDNAQLIAAQATAFRQFTRARNNVVSPGTPFHMYFEPRNLTTRFDGRAVRVSMTIDLELRNSAGEAVGRQTAAWNLPIEHPSTQNVPLPPAYASLSFNFNQLADGAYTVVLQVRDDFGSGTAQTVFAIQVRNRAAVPPQAQAPQAPAPTPQAPRQPRAEVPRAPAAPAPVRPASQISIERAEVLSVQATGFRQFAAPPSRVVPQGSGFSLYIEPRSFQTRFDGSFIRGAMTVDFLMRNAAGQVVLQEAGAWKFPLAVASTTDGRLNSIYASLAVNPLNVPAGAYKIVLRVSDDIGGSVTEVTLDVEFRSQAPQAEAPRNPNQDTVPPIAQAPTAPTQPRFDLRNNRIIP